MVRCLKRAASHSQHGRNSRAAACLKASFSLAALLAGYAALGEDCPLAITNQPQSLLVLQNCHATFEVGVTGAPPLFFQWYGDEASIIGATNSSYTVEFAQLADNGAMFRVVVTNSWCAVTSTAAVLLISADVVPPTVLRAVGGPTLNTVTIYFSVGGGAGCASGQLDPASAMDVFNYTLTGGLVVSNAVLAPGGTNVILTTGPQTPGAEYTLYVAHVMDLAGNQILPDSSVTFRAWVPITVSIQRLGTNCVISWEPAGGTLEAADEVAGAWTELPAAVSPYSFPADGPRRFYRVVLPP